MKNTAPGTTKDSGLLIRRGAREYAGDGTVERIHNKADNHACSFVFKVGSQKELPVTCGTRGWPDRQMTKMFRRQGEEAERGLISR